MLKARKSEQISTLYRSIELVTDFSVAIDGGANVGDWLRVMSEKFGLVHAFEPNARLIEILKVKNFPNVCLHHAALWSHECKVTLNDYARAPAKDRAKFCTEGGDIQANTIDSLSLQSCGLIKLDLEGAEVLALRGAAKTLKKFHSVVIVECKTSAVSSLNQEKPGQFLKPMGYIEAFRFGPDRVYTWQK